MGKRANTQGKSGTKIDLGPSFRDWQTAAELSKQISDTSNNVRKYADTNKKCNGYFISSRAPVPEDNAHPMTNFLYRVEYEDERMARRAQELAEEVEALKALGVTDTSVELSHAKKLLARRNKELEAELAMLRGESVSIAAHKEVLAGRDEYIMALKYECADLKKEVADTSKGSIRIAAHREALEQKDRYIQTLRDELSASQNEARQWSRTTTSLQDSLEEMHDKYMDLLDMQSRRGLARRVARRVLEAVK